MHCCWGCDMLQTISPPGLWHTREGKGVVLLYVVGALTPAHRATPQSHEEAKWQQQQGQADS